MHVFAHRGASGDFPENTLLAVEQAISQGAYGVEIDVQQCLDGCVVFHNRKVLWRGKLHFISSLTLPQIKQIPLPHGQYIPTLEEVLQTVNGRCVVNIELKTIHTLEWIGDILGRALREYHFAPEQLLVSAFNHRLLLEVSNWQMGVKIGALTASLPRDYAGFAVDLQATSVHADINVVDAALIADTHARGMQLFVYTVDDEDDIEQLITWQADGIFSNFPGKGRAIVQRIRLAARL